MDKSLDDVSLPLLLLCHEKPIVSQIFNRSSPPSLGLVVVQVVALAPALKSLVRPLFHLYSVPVLRT